jgi:hypothetical protein
VISPALGDYEALIEAWNGHRWRVLPTPGYRYNDELSGVSCVSATMCVAVGELLAGYFSRPIIDVWNGTVWSKMASPHNTGVGIGNGLGSVSCASATFCMAVGGSTIESWYGHRWRKMPSPDKGHYSNVLNTVSCASVAFCMAVGHYESFAPWSTLVKFWNGTRWSLVPSPNDPSDHNDQLIGVSCFSAAACVAVGFSGGVHGVDDTLIESWNGTRWTLRHSANPGPLRNGLYGVSCASPTACTAVGYYRRAGRTLVESTTASG